MKIEACYFIEETEDEYLAYVSNRHVEGRLIGYVSSFHLTTGGRDEALMVPLAQRGDAAIIARKLQERLNKLLTMTQVSATVLKNGLTDFEIKKKYFDGYVNGDLTIGYTVKATTLEYENYGGS